MDRKRHIADSDLVWHRGDHRPRRYRLDTNNLTLEVSTKVSIDHSEKELLEVLERYGELNPVEAATKTSLTVSEADQMLSEFAQKGYLQVRIDGGKMSYALWERNLQEPC